MGFLARRCRGCLLVVLLWHALGPCACSLSLFTSEASACVNVPQDTTLAAVTRTATAAQGWMRGACAKLAREPFRTIDA